MWKTSHQIRDLFLCEHLYELKYIPKSEEIRTANWIYCRYIEDPKHEILYNSLRDPLEENNPAYVDSSVSEPELLRKECEIKIEEPINAR